MIKKNKYYYRKKIRDITSNILMTMVILSLSFLIFTLLKIGIERWIDKNEASQDSLGFNDHCNRYYLQRLDGKDHITINRDSEIIIKFNENGRCDVIIQLDNQS
ncbi:MULTISPECIES: hypothetical protein [Gallibacterium]|uniref:Uncharacterized protein n=1 Tax=Gallibacterium genomosp. 3 TaxID=505345 RepID=A0A1A7PXQ8_9PAST|nr:MULTISPECIES: hypothetical protein [Gallibacterium]OBW94228.1 hypothetical protein QV02_08095 [Gallibacterium anatis]OBX07363.1 hypothetical protein QV07_07005 [Gallibacterium genomosp. 3]